MRVKRKAISSSPHFHHRPESKWATCSRLLFSSAKNNWLLINGRTNADISNGVFVISRALLCVFHLIEQIIWDHWDKYCFVILPIKNGILYRNKEHIDHLRESYAGARLLNILWSCIRHFCKLSCYFFASKWKQTGERFKVFISLSVWQNGFDRCTQFCYRISYLATENCNVLEGAYNSFKQRRFSISQMRLSQQLYFVVCVKLWWWWGKYPVQSSSMEEILESNFTPPTSCKMGDPWRWKQLLRPMIQL